MEGQTYTLTDGGSIMLGDQCIAAAEGDTLEGVVKALNSERSRAAGVVEAAREIVKEEDEHVGFCTFIEAKTRKRLADILRPALSAYAAGKGGA